MAVTPDPDFTDSRALRIYLNNARRVLHRAAMELHISASELEAALRTVPGESRSVQRRRARRVSRHLKHAAECLVAASSATVRTWGTFQAEYNVKAQIRGGRPAFKVIP